MKSHTTSNFVRLINVNPLLESIGQTDLVTQSNAIHLSDIIKLGNNRQIQSQISDEEKGLASQPVTLANQNVEHHNQPLTHVSQTLYPLFERLTVIKPNQPAIAAAAKAQVQLLQTETKPNSIGLAALDSIPTQKPDLTGRFAVVNLPDTIDYGDRGQVQIIVTNKGNAIARGSVTVKLWISTDDTIDKNDLVLSSALKNINLQSGQSTTFNLSYDNMTSVVSPGAYYLIAQIDSENAITERLESNNVISKLVSAPGTDVVIDWNAAALNAIQAEGEVGRGVPPTLGSRLMAIVSTAVYDTINSFERSHIPYLVDLNAPVGASVEAAAASAAHYVLSVLLPGQASLLNQQLVKSLIEITDTPLSEAMGVAFGQSVAKQILTARLTDNSDDPTPYEPPIGDYVWKPGLDGISLGPKWGNLTPFGIPNADDFLPDGCDGTPTGDVDRYIREIEEVRLFGGKENTALTTLARTPDQTELAVFWAYDRADTFRPYGQLNQIAQEIAVREGTSLLDNARLFAALNVAQADAVVVAWKAKYIDNQPRPDDVIAEGIAANDGFEATVGDPNWRPLIEVTGSKTPPFPDYISGHSVMGGAFASVLTHFFGENYEFDAVSQELPGVVRHFDSFYESGLENALSRIYLGVHTREASVDEALPVGLEVGNYICKNLFQPVV